MTEDEQKTKVTGAMLIALPGAVVNYVTENSTAKFNNYSAYFWLDDDRALYLHGNTGYGRSSGNFMGRFAEQIGTEYFADLRAVLEGDSLLEAIQDIQSVQIDSKEASWFGSMDEFLGLVGLVRPEDINFWKNARDYADRKMKETEGLERVKDKTE